MGTVTGDLESRVTALEESTRQLKSALNKLVTCLPCAKDIFTDCIFRTIEPNANGESDHSLNKQNQSSIEKKTMGHFPSVSKDPPHKSTPIASYKESYMPSASIITAKPNGLYSGLCDYLHGFANAEHNSYSPSMIPTNKGSTSIKAPVILSTGEAKMLREKDLSRNTNAVTEKSTQPIPSDLRPYKFWSKDHEEGQRSDKGYINDSNRIEERGQRSWNLHSNHKYDKRAENCCSSRTEKDHSAPKESQVHHAIYPKNYQEGNIIWKKKAEVKRNSQLYLKRAVIRNTIPHTGAIMKDFKGEINEKNGKKFQLPRKLGGKQINALQIIEMWEYGLGAIPPIKDWTPADKMAQQSKVSRWKKIQHIFTNDCYGNINIFLNKYSEHGKLMPVSKIFKKFDAENTRKQKEGSQ